MSAEPRFCLTMAIAMAVVIALGFSIQLAIGAIAFSPPGQAFYGLVTRGTPGAAVPPLVFPPPPFG